MIVMITGSDNKVYTEYLNVPAATTRDSANAATKYAPKDAGGLNYIADTYGANGNYQGGWFDPTDSTMYPDTTPNAPASPVVPLPNGVTWTKVALVRAFQGVANAAAFSSDPYEFTLVTTNLTTTPAGSFTNANPGALAFNTLAAGETVSCR